MNKLLSFSKRFLALSVGLLVFFACHITSTQETEETFTFPTLKDKIAGADHVNITLKDTLGNPIDVLFNGPVDSTTSFKNLSAKNYHGGKVIIDIEAKQGTVVIYSVERGYDASKGGNQGQVVLIAPNMSVDFTFLSLRIREGEVVALPSVAIQPADLGNKGLLWISRSPHILEVSGQTLKALVPGTATLVVRLAADTTRKDSLEVEVFSKNDPVRLIDSLRLSPDTLRLALKGPEGRFTVRAYPTTPTTEAQWTSLNPAVFSVDSSGLLKPLTEGLGRVVATSILDAAVTDTGFVLILAPQKVDSVRFQKANTDLFVGGAAESLTVQVHPPLANPAVTLTAEDASLVRVTGHSLQGLKEGETRVFARSVEDPTKADTLTVVLFPAEKVDSVRLKQDSLKLYVRGENQTLTATLYPATLQPRYLWRSADSKVATVDATGKVSPVAAGKAYVSVTARADAEKRDSALVIVKRDMPRLQVGQDTIVSAGITVTHRPVVTQEYGLVVIFKWDLNGDGLFEDSSATVPATLSFHYGDIKEYKATFYVRDTEGNDTVYHRKVKAVTGRVVQITSPKDGSSTNQSSITVHWTVDGQPQSNTQGLNPGANAVIREARDSAGKVFSHAITVHLDQTPPNRPTVRGSQIPVNSLTPTWTWSSGGGGGNGIYRYQLDNSDLATAPTTTDTFFTAGVLPPGPHILFVQEQDLAGNWSVSGNALFRIDTTAPGAPAVSVAPSGQTNETRPTWSWSGAPGDTYQYYRYKFGNDDFRSGGKDVMGTSLRPATALSEGSHTLFVQVRDSAGNWSASGSATILIDLQGPSAPAVTVPLALTNDSTPTWNWSTNMPGTVQFRIRLDNSDMSQAMETTSKTFSPATPLSEGVHVLYVQERDLAGNWSAVGSAQVRLDFTPPAPPQIDSTPYSPLNSLRPKFTWKSGAGGAKIFRVKIDDPAMTGAAEFSDSSFAPATDLVAGPHTIYVQQRDSAGNWSNSASRTLHLALRGQLGLSFSQKTSRIIDMVVASTGTPYVAFTDENDGHKIRVKKYGQNGWEWAGLPPYSVGPAFYGTLAFDSKGNLYLGFMDQLESSGRHTVYIYKQIGSEWAAVGGGILASNLMNGEGAYLAISKNDVPYMAYKHFKDTIDGFDQVVVKRFFQDTWETVSPELVPSVMGLAFDGTGNLVLASNHSIVLQFNEGNKTWNPMNNGLPSVGAHFYQLTVGAAGKPVLGFSDAGNSHRASVMEYSNGAWTLLGNQGLSRAGFGDLRIAFHQNTAFVGYDDLSVPGSGPSIMKLRNGTWEFIGAPGFGVGQFFTGTKLRVLPNGVPIHAATDSDGKAAVFQSSYDP